MSIEVDIEELFQELEETIEEIKRLKEEQNGEIDDEQIPTSLDLGVVTDTNEYILNHFKNKPRPIWAEAFHQIYGWQFSILYEGIDVYYENVYEENDYKTIMKVGQYLKENGYAEFYEYYVAPAIDCKPNEYPTDEEYPAWRANLKKTEEWAVEVKNLEMVWNFYVDILTKNKAALIALQKEKQK